MLNHTWPKSGKVSGYCGKRHMIHRVNEFMLLLCRRTCATKALDSWRLLCWVFWWCFCFCSSYFGIVYLREVERNLHETHSRKSRFLFVTNVIFVDLEIPRCGLWNIVLFGLGMLSVGLAERWQNLSLTGAFSLSVLSAAERGFCPFLSLCPKSSRAAVALRLQCGLFLILFLGKDYFPGFVHIVVEYYLFFKIGTVSSIVGRGVVSHWTVSPSSLYWVWVSLKLFLGRWAMTFFFLSLLTQKKPLGLVAASGQLYWPRDWGIIALCSLLIGSSEPQIWTSHIAWQDWEWLGRPLTDASFLWTCQTSWSHLVFCFSLVPLFPFTFSWLLFCPDIYFHGFSLGLSQKAKKWFHGFLKPSLKSHIFYFLSYIAWTCGLLSALAFPVLQLQSVYHVTQNYIIFLLLNGPWFKVPSSC